MAHYSPAHYTRGSIEVWDYIRDQQLNYHLGNAVKYISRAGFKNANSKAQDLKKAIHYLENELQHALQQKQSLSDQALEFRTAYGIQNSKESRTMQRDLIVEEFKEFMYAATEEGYEDELKELADLGLCLRSSTPRTWTGI